MKEPDTIREAQKALNIYIEGVVAHKAGFSGVDEGKRHAKYLLQKIAFAALSAVEADAKPQEPREDNIELAKNIIDDVLEEEYGAIARAAALITAHDDAIRQECDELLDAARATLRATDRVAFAWKVGKCGPLSPNSCYVPDIAAALARLRASILSTEPAILIRDLDPAAADCVQKHFNELIGTKDGH